MKIEKVFISSTTLGLGSYRRYVKSFLEEWYNSSMTETQEKFTADDDSVQTVMGNKIMECDRVICIIGPFLGSCPTYQSSGQRQSYAQLEYEVAKKNNMPLYIFDGRECNELDEADQSEEDRQIQEAFWKKLERNEHRLRKSFRNHEDLIHSLIKLIKGWMGKSDSLRNLPTPFFQWEQRVQSQAQASANESLNRLLHFVVCLAAAEVSHPEPLPINQIKDLLKRASRNQFVRGLEYSKFISILNWQNMPYEDKSFKDIPNHFEDAKQLLSVLREYLLIRIERDEFGFHLLVYRGPQPTWVRHMEPCEGLDPEAYHGDLFLLNVNRKECLQLSPYLQSHPEDPDVLCVWWRDKPETSGLLKPLSDFDPVKAQFSELIVPSKTPLLASKSWLNAIFQA